MTKVRRKKENIIEAQHLSVTEDLRRSLQQQEAEIKLLHKEREALFALAPFHKCKRDEVEGNQQERSRADSDIPRNWL